MNLYSVDRDYFFDKFYEIINNAIEGFEPTEYYFLVENDVLAMKAVPEYPNKNTVTASVSFELNGAKSDVLSGLTKWTENLDNYICSFLNDKNFEVLTINPNEITKGVSIMANKEKKNVAISFASVQMFNERPLLNEDGSPRLDKNNKEIRLVSVSLPSSAEHKGFYIDLRKDFVHQSQKNEKMSYTYFRPDYEVTIHKYDKETKQREDIKISVSDLKKEMNSWRKEKNNDKTQEQNQDEPDIADE